MLDLDRFAPRTGSTPAIKCSGMGAIIELQNLGDAKLCRDITVHLEHTFSGRQGEWRVSFAGSRAAESWDLRVEGPNRFERSYTLSGLPPVSMSFRQSGRLF